jgi:hypothetical protein
MIILLKLFKSQELIRKCTISKIFIFMIMFRKGMVKLDKFNNVISLHSLVKIANHTFLRVRVLIINNYF